MTTQASLRLQLTALLFFSAVSFGASQGEKLFCTPGDWFFDRTSTRAHQVELTERATVSWGARSISFAPERRQLVAREQNRQAPLWSRACDEPATHWCVLRTEHPVVSTLQAVMAGDAIVLVGFSSTGATSGAELLALDWRSGRELWRVRTEVEGFPFIEVAAAGPVVAVAGQGRLQAYRVDSGALGFAKQAQGSSTPWPKLASQRKAGAAALLAWAAGTDDPEIQVIDASTGSTVATQSVARRVNGVSLWGETLLVTSGHQVAAFQALTGVPIWQHVFADHQTVGAPSVDDRGVAVALAFAVGETDNREAHRVAVLDAASGAEVWHRQFDTVGRLSLEGAELEVSTNTDVQTFKRVTSESLATPITVRGRIVVPARLKPANGFEVLVGTQTVKVDADNRFVASVREPGAIRVELRNPHDVMREDDARIAVSRPIWVEAKPGQTTAEVELQIELRFPR